MAIELHYEKQGTGVAGATGDPRRVPLIPRRSDEIPIKELFDNDPNLGHEVFKMSRYLSLEPVPIGAETSSRLAMIGCVAKSDADGGSQLDRDVKDYPEAPITKKSVI